MTDEKLWLLVSLKLSGEATTKELTELDALVQQDFLLAERAAVMEYVWKSGKDELPEQKGAMSFDRHLQRLNNYLGAPVLQFDDDASIENNEESIKRLPWFSRNRWWASAAVAVSLVAGFFLLQSNFKNNAKPTITGNTVSTKPGSKSKIELPDGTQVWLNADSKLEYSGDFSGKLREVRLTGEAYFDVVKDKSRPFIIHTNTIQVKVLGTAFNVRSYPAEKTTETALIRGSVEVTLNAHPDKKVVLKPNEKVVIDNNPAEIIATDKQKATLIQSSMVVGAVHLDKKDQEVYETMWVKNKLAFDETPFDNMIAEIERWYNVSIVVKNKALSAGTYTVTFENKTLDEVLEGLQFSAHFQYQLKDGVVTIW